MKLEHYVNIVPINDDRYQIVYKVKDQEFVIACSGYAELSEAVWFRDQFLTALRVMVSEVTDS